MCEPFFDWQFVRHRFTYFKIFAVALLVCLQLSVSAQGPRLAERETNYNSLSEVRYKRRALLIVFKSSIVDAGGSEQIILEKVLKTDPQPRGRFRWVYGQLAKKLNEYIRKYRSLTAADDLGDADYVISFNVVEYRTILNATYPYGELFVIAKGVPETQTPPRVIWRGKKVLFAGDAIGDLIKDLRAVRGEL